MKKAYKFKNSNLIFHGMKMDINGNPCFVLSTPNQRAFSVQQPYSITIHWSTKNGNSKESGVEIVEKNTKGNPFKSEEEFESYVLDLAKGRKHVKVYGNNFACGGKNFSIKDTIKSLRQEKKGKKYYSISNTYDGDVSVVKSIEKENGRIVLRSWFFEKGKLYDFTLRKSGIIETKLNKDEKYYKDCYPKGELVFNENTLSYISNENGVFFEEDIEKIESQEEKKLAKSLFSDFNKNKGKLFSAKITQAELVSKLEYDGYTMVEPFKLEDMARKDFGINFSLIDDVKKGAKKIDKKFECGILMF